MHTFLLLPVTLLGFLLFHWQLLFRLLCSLFLFRQALKYGDPQEYVLGALFSLFTPSCKVHLCSSISLASITIRVLMTSKVIQAIFSFLNTSSIAPSVCWTSHFGWWPCLVGMSFSMSPFATLNLFLLLCPISSQWKPLPSIQLPCPANILDVFLAFYSTCRELPSPFNTISFSIPVDTTV